jgi:hypothetical protein
VNIYTDSKFAFATLHMDGAIYKETELLTVGGKKIKNKEEILQLLEAVWEPSQVSIIHCRGHQRGTDNVSRGNGLADQVERKTAKELSSPGVLKHCCWLWSCLPPCVTPRRKNNGKKIKKEYKKGGLVEVA